MKKLLSIILIALVFAGAVMAQTPVLDQIYEIPWLGEGGRVYYILTDANMKGYKDTSVTIPIPPGTGSMDFWVDADSSSQDSAGVIEADSDSIFYIGYLIPVGQGTASWVILGGDTLIELHQADSGATGKWHWNEVIDSFWYPVIAAFADTLKNDHILHSFGETNLYGRKYEAVQFLVRLGGVGGVISDTGSIHNRAFLRFNSRQNSWGISGFSNFNIIR